MEIKDEFFNENVKIKKKINEDKNYGLDFSEKDFIKRMSFLNPQSYGARIEKRILKLLLNKRVMLMLESKFELQKCKRASKF